MIILLHLCTNSEEEHRQDTPMVPKAGFDLRYFHFFNSDAEFTGINHNPQEVMSPS
jgi:hypothetical protein